VVAGTVGSAGEQVPVLVLAAGSGARFRAAGGTTPKVLAPLDGRAILAHVLDVAAAAGPVVTVVSPSLADDPAFAAIVAGRPQLRVVVNARAEDGMGTSLSAGLATLADDDGTASRTSGACVVLLGDQPEVDATVVAAVVRAWRRTGLPARTRYTDGPGHPVVLPRDLWPRLDHATDEGARALLAALEVVEVPVATSAPRDVDVPADLAHIAADRGDPSAPDMRRPPGASAGASADGEA